MLRRIWLTAAFMMVICLPGCFESCKSRGEEPRPTRPSHPPVVDWPKEPPQDRD